MNITDECIEKSQFDKLIPLSVLSDDHRDELRDHSRILSLDTGEHFAGDENDDQFTYYLVEGRLGLFVGERSLDTIEADSDVARFALTRLNSAAVSGQALTPVKLLRLDISLVSTLLIWVQSADDDHARALTMDDDSGWVPKVLGSELFARIPPANIQQLFHHLQPQDVKADEVIIRQGDVGDYYYIVRSGSCAVTRLAEDSKLPVLLASLGPGDSFGEEALVANATRNASVTMVTDGSLLRLTQDDFHKLVIAPVLSEVDCAEARDIVARGGHWLDVRLQEEFQCNGIEQSLHIALNQLRDKSTELDSELTYVVYSDTARRSMAAALVLAQRGFNTHVLTGGLVRNPELCGPGMTTEVRAEPATTPVSSAPDPRELSRELEAANEDVENALQNKLDATSARRLLASELETEHQEQAKRQLAARQKRLELESASATAALAQAQRRKLEAESKMRSAEALAERRRAEAELECENLRRSAEQRLQVEEKRLQKQYAVAANKLEALKRTRDETELRLKKERERIDEELAQSQQTLEFEAEKIKSDLERVRRDSAQKTERIQDDKAIQEEQVRTETELALKQERQRLEAEFASSVSSLEKAQQKLDDASREKQETDAESQRIVAAMRAAEEQRRAQAEAERKAEQEQLTAQAEEAHTALKKAEQLKQDAEEKRRLAIQRLARLRAASGDEPATDGQEEDLKAEIQRIDQNVSDALGEVDAARRAKDDADAVKFATEEKAAHQRASEEELRLKLHQEAEDWLEQERARSAAELERAKADLAEKWAIKEEAERRRRKTLEEQDSSLLGDITAQLELSEITEAVGNKAYQEEQAQLALAAKAKVEADKERSLEALHEASKQISKLKRQGLLD